LRHFTQLDGVVVAHELIGGDEVVAADDEHGLRQDVELAQHVLHPPVAGDGHFASGIAQQDLHRRWTSRAVYPKMTA
jgi:hypothetical protein